VGNRLETRDVSEGGGGEGHGGGWGRREEEWKQVEERGRGEGQGKWEGGRGGVGELARAGGMVERELGSWKGREVGKEGVGWEWQRRGRGG